MRGMTRVMIAVVMLVGCFVVVAQENGEKTRQPEMSAEQQAMMVAWAKAGTPGPEHEWLAQMAGTWSLEVKSWMDPKAPPTVSTAKSDVRTIMGGRYVQERLEGTVMGERFAGLGFTGYDNTRKRYVSVWMDNMSTRILESEGTYDEKTRTMTMTGSHVDPVTGKLKRMRSTCHRETTDLIVMTYYDTAPDGTEFKSMEITYTRV